VTFATHVLRFAVGTVAMATACHSVSGSQPGEGGLGPVAVAPTASAGPPASVASAAPHRRPQVLLTWRLFETQRWLDHDGTEHQSSIFELLIQGGTPPHVQFGRRESFGCAIKETTGDSLSVTDLDCYANAHGEYASVTRPSAGELRIEAFGQDEAYPEHVPPRTNVQVATVQIPSESETVLEQELAIVPAEIPTR
jgi:hypothetical protein